MKMTKIEIQKICEMANFLDDKGYTRKIEGDTILYSNNRINIIITFEPNSDVSNVSIKFIKENEFYNVGWIACVRSGLNVNPHQRLGSVLALLSYIRENYSMMMDIDYCKESNRLVDEFIDNELRKKIGSNNEVNKT